MKKVLKIVGRKPNIRGMASGTLRRDMMRIATVDLEVDESDIPPWFDDLIERMEQRYTPSHPSIMDQVHFMVALGSLVSKTPPADAPKTISEAMHFLGFPLGLRFDEDPELKFFPDSPDAGHYACICSYCEEVIHEAPVIRFFHRDNNTEVRLHQDCLEVCVEFHLIPDHDS